MTGRVRSLEALKKSQARLEGILHSAMDAIVTVDEQQNVMMFNPAAEYLFRCKADKVIGKPLDRFLPERLRIERSAATGITSRSLGGQGSAGKRAMRHRTRAISEPISPTPLTATSGRRSTAPREKDIVTPLQRRATGGHHAPFLSRETRLDCDRAEHTLSRVFCSLRPALTTCPPASTARGSRHKP